MGAGWGKILALAAATIVLPVLVSFGVLGMKGEWSWEPLPSVVFHLPLVLAASIASAYAVRRPEAVQRFLYAGMLVAVFVDVIVAIAFVAFIQHSRDRDVYWLLGFVPPVWLALAMAAYAGRAIAPGVRRLAVIAGCAFFVALPLATLHRDRTFWHALPDPGEAEARKARLAVAREEVLYAQPRILERDLAAIQPGKPGRVDVFFVGVAGFGGQDVFLREVVAVARLFEERFGAAGRVVRLVNNPKTVLEMPIASVTGLRATLERLAAVMDRDEDVLVLFMTSHGSERHRLELDLGPIRFQPIDPARLRALLDESGIRHRVVIVSACYSGGFLPQLQDRDTLAIAAAAADRQSFGCSNESHWTYFGKAYFDEALRSTHSFVEAFDKALPAIAAREREERHEPSLPQISVGEGIRPRLERLQAELEGRR